MKFSNKRNIVRYFASRFAFLALFVALLVVGRTSSVNASLLDFFGYNNDTEEDYTLENINGKQQVEYASGESIGADETTEQEVEDSEIASIIEQNRKLLMLPEAKRQILKPAVLRNNDLSNSLKPNKTSSTAQAIKENTNTSINNIRAPYPLEKEVLQNSNLAIEVEAKQNLGRSATKDLEEKNSSKAKDSLQDASLEYSRDTQNAKVPNVAKIPSSKKLPPKTFSLKNVNKQKSALEQAKIIKIAEEGDNADRELAEEKPLANAKKFYYKPNLAKKQQQVKPDLGNSSNPELANSDQDEELQKNNTDKAVQNVVAKKVTTKTASEDLLLTSADADLARAESKNSLDNSKNKVKAKLPKSMVKKPSLAPTEIVEKGEKPILAKLEPASGSNRQKYAQDIVRDIKNRKNYLQSQRTASDYKVALPQGGGNDPKKSILAESGPISPMLPPLLQGESQEKNKAPLNSEYVNKSALTYEQDNSLLNANRRDLQKNAELDYSSLNRKIDQFKPRTPTPNRLFGVDISKPDRFNNSNNLVKKTGSFYRAFGEIVLLQGQVTDSFGVPVVNAVIEIWQANSAGKYHNLLEPDSEYIDRYFNMSGRAVTDNLGYYNFITIIPGSIPNRTPHINMNLKHKNFGTLETEVYFFQHPENKKDSHYLSYSPQERAMLTAMVEYSQLNNPKSLKVATFNIVVRGSHQYKKY
jgi:protocatechuate 3,4-dioxygenase beta subunit